MRGLRAARTVVLMASRHAYASDQVVREMYLAMSEKKPIVPLELETAEIPDELQYILAPFQRHRLEGGDRSSIDPQRARSAVRRRLQGGPHPRRVETRCSSMILECDDKVVSNEATAADIDRALAERPRREGWYLNLSVSPDVYVEAKPAAGGGFTVEYEDRGGLYRAAAPLDEAVLRRLLAGYLAGDVALEDALRLDG